MNNEITDEKLDKYFAITKEAISKVRFHKLSDEQQSIANDFFSMALNYFSDADHFRKSGDYVSAFGALNYAHAWLDALARMKLIDVKDSRLFASD